MTPTSVATAPDRRFSVGLAADYRLNRRQGLTADLNWIDQASNGAAPGPRYRALRPDRGGGGALLTPGDH